MEEQTYSFSFRKTCLSLRELIEPTYTKQRDIVVILQGEWTMPKRGQVLSKVMVCVRRLHAGHGGDIAYLPTEWDLVIDIEV